MEWLLDPLAFGFFRRALLAATLVGGICALIGVYVVLRGMAFLGEALSHAVMPGVAIAHLYHLNVSIGGLAAGVLTAVGIGYVGRHRRIKEDTAIGILLAGAFALGIAIISTVRTYTVDLTHFLFGNVLAVSVQDLRWIAVVGVISVTALLFMHRRWTVLAFDATYAEVSGLWVGSLHNAMMILLAMTIVAAMQTVGVLLVMAMLVTAPATARLTANRIGSMMWQSVLWGIASSVIGLYLSYYLDIASGASIVLVGVALFFVVLGSTSARSRRKNRSMSQMTPHPN